MKKKIRKFNCYSSILQFVFIFSMSLSPACLGCIYLLFPQGLHDSIYLVMTLFGLFLICDPRAISSSSSSLAPRLSVPVWLISTNVSLKAITRGEVQQLKMKSLNWRYAKYSQNLTWNATRFYSHASKEKSLISNVGCYFGKKGCGMCFTEDNLQVNNSLLIEPSPLPKKCMFKLWDKNIEE